MEQASRTLVAGILVFRWAALVWMTVLVATASEPLRSPLLAGGALGLTAAWTTWLTLVRKRTSQFPLTVSLDLAVCVSLILVSGLVVPEGQLLSGHPFFAATYPVSAALVWGAARGPGAGLGAGVVLAIALMFSRPVNGISFHALTASQWQSLANACVVFVLAGGAFGVVAQLLRRSSEELRVATDEAIAARERAARLSERERMAREIHDSLLQSLALMHKRGRELAGETPPSKEGIRSLAEMAAAQERELRGLVLRQPEAPPVGMASLRDEMERLAREVNDSSVEVSAVGPVWLPAQRVSEIAAAVRQALANVTEHAEAGRVTIHVDPADGWVNVSVRDDGRGFVYDESGLEQAGRAGILRSIKGRIEDLGGTVRIDTAPGAGTEVELRVPMEARE